MRKPSMVILLILIIALGGMLIQTLLFSRSLNPINEQSESVTPVGVSIMADDPKEGENVSKNDIISENTVASDTKDKSDVLLVNKENPLPDGYDPGELVNLFERKDRHFQLARADIEVASVVYTAMDKMFAAALDDGVDGFIITSGYRSREKQAEIFTEDTEGVAARPGESEHESGLAFDVVAMGNDDFEKTPQFNWLFKHCAEYGFILRYPKDTEDITGFPYESWHYRYVGVSHASAIMSAGLTLEHYLE